MFIFPQTQRLSKYTINMQRKVIFLTCYALVEFLCKDWNIQCTVKLKIYCTTLNLLAWTFFYSTVKHTWSMRFGSLINQAFSWLCFWSAVLLLFNRIFQSTENTIVEWWISEHLKLSSGCISLWFTAYIHLLEANCEHNRKLKRLCWKSFSTVDLNSKC